MCSLPILMIYLEQTLAILSVNIKDAVKLKQHLVRPILFNYDLWFHSS